jgi:hypothetical protein
MNKLILTSLLLSASLFASMGAFASDAAWVFAHRVNSLEAVSVASNDSGINAIEIDVSHRDDVPAKKACAETWCAYHSGDPVAENLSAILKAAEYNQQFGAVWLDVKSTAKSQADYANIIKTVKMTLGTGEGSVRKFWGVYPATELNTPYVTAIQQNLTQLGGNDENLIIIEADSNSDTDAANAQCREWGIQCGLSVGNAFLGSLGTSSGPSWDMQNFNYISGDIEHMTNINSTFMWTFNWGGPYEDDMVRLLFAHRSYWEYLAGFEWQCGQEGNGVIVGGMNSIYYEGFCENTDQGDACSIANQAIDNGPNRLGDRYSNVGTARNSYGSVSAYDCDKYY